MDPSTPNPKISPGVDPPNSATMDGSEKRKTKRSRKKRSTAGSGTSTPRIGNDKEKVLAETTTKIQAGTSRSLPAVTNNDNGSKPSNTSFAEENEFIPFGPDDGDGEGVEPVPEESKGKGKELDAGDPFPARSKGKERAQDSDERDRERRRSGTFREDRISRRERRERDRKRSRSRSASPGRDRGKRSRTQYEAENKPSPHDYGCTSKAPWIRGLDLENCKNVADMMHREVEAFTNWISPTPVEDEIRGLIVRQISQAVSGKFPDATLTPFGSYETKLYLPLGDIDLVILSDSMAWSDKVTVLHALANTLKRCGITNRVTIIAKARVPIVKFVTNHGRFNVDISINQANGLVSGNIVNGFLRYLHPNPRNETSMALRSLVLITKAFLAQRGMNEVYTGGLGSYSIVCMAVSFLQMHPKIRRGEIDPDENLGVLVMEFFELYGCLFNYDEVGVSVRDGGTYFSKRQRGWFDYTKRGLLSIEDPADPSNDISKGSFGFHKVKTALAGAHSILTATAYLRAGILNSRRHSQSVPLRGRYEQDDLSILSTVMGITQETLNHRRLVQELYDQRTLHSALEVETALRDEPSSSSRNLKSNSRNKERVPPPSNRNEKELRIHGAAANRPIHIYLSDASDVSPDGGYRGAQDQLVQDYDDEEEGERSRYDIGQPPRKRQRTGKAMQDFHTVQFVTDDDDDEMDLLSRIDNPSTNLRKERADVGRERDSDPEKEKEAKERMDKKRSYWLSKGIGPGLGDNQAIEVYSSD